MAIIKHGILSGGSGSVGTVTMNLWKSIPTIKSRQTTTPESSTEAQLDVRNKTKNAAQFGSIVTDNRLNPYWLPIKQKDTGFNRWFVRNRNHFTALFPNPRGSLFMSPSSIPKVNVHVPRVFGGRKFIEVDWDYTPGIYPQQADDQAIIMIVNNRRSPRDTIYWIEYHDTNFTRDSPLVVIEPKQILPPQQQIWSNVFFLSQDGERLFADDWRGVNY